MKRDAIEQLYKWKEKPNRKPLIIHGVRQVGKTWLMKEFANEAYKNHVYINFEDNEIAKKLFQEDFDIDRIILTLQVISGKIIDKNTLIIFDEIQEAPRGLTSLKYFYEKSPEIPIIAAGSLLGISMHKGDSFPVGKVDFINLYPMSFTEFLSAVGQDILSNLIKILNWEVLNVFHEKLSFYLKQYYIVGGMPEAVKTFAEHKDLSMVTDVHNAILDSYDRDFSKHAPLQEVPRIRMVWKSIIAQLSKENKKFVYGVLKNGARAKEFELAIEWLKDAGLIHKINRVKKASLPLAAYEDFSAFKLYMCDIGLMCTMAKISHISLLQNDTLFVEFKGAMTEQYVLQQMLCMPNIAIYYWSAENSKGELDFLVQNNDNIIPIEVKANENLQSKSLRYFIEKNKGLHGLRFSMSPFREQDWMSNYPLYACGAWSLNGYYI